MIIQIAEPAIRPIVFGGAIAVPCDGRAVPTYIAMQRINLYVASACPELLPILGKAHLELDSSFHTYATYVVKLREIAAANPTLVADALIDDGYDNEFLLRARAGTVAVTALDGTESNDQRVVAERVRAGEYAQPGAVPRDPGQRYEQPLYWPEPMLEFLQHQAARLDRSLSWLATFAYKSSRESFATANWVQLHHVVKTSGLDGGRKRKASLQFSGDMIDELQRLAETKDCSASLLAQAAVASAKPLIEAQQPAN